LTDWILRDHAPVLLPSQTARQEFLMLLERDVEGMVFCHFCQWIHRPDMFDIGFKESNERKCFAPKSNVLLNYDLGELNYGHICNLKKSIHLSPDNGSAALARLSKTVTTYRRMTHQVSLSARIISGTFYLRAQHRFSFLATSPPRIPDFHYLTNFCLHQRKFDGKFGIGIEHYLRCPNSKSGCITCEQCNRVTMCAECCTELQVDVKELRNGRAVLVVTVWQDLGDLQSPFNDKWISRFRVGHRINTSYAEQRIKDTFEEGRPGCIPSYLQDITGEDEAALLK
jgi:hypothetical protein